MPTRHVTTSRVAQDSLLTSDPDPDHHPCPPSSRQIVLKISSIRPPLPGTLSMDRSNLTTLVNYIEANLRASQQAGLPFVDPRGHREKILVHQNHVLFGRRGAGKSTLLRSLTSNRCVPIPVNCEDYKDSTFPNIVIQILLRMLEVIRSEHRRRNRWWWFLLPGSSLRRELYDLSAELRELLERPDTEEVQLTVTQSSSTGAQMQGSVGPATGRAGLGHRAETQEAQILERDKLTWLRQHLPRLKTVISDAARALSSNGIFLILDDYYFLDRMIQPDCVDFFHRLTKDTPLYVKLGTIRHRTSLVRRTKRQTVGVEVGHDILEIDMDYMLDRFAELKVFMGQLLREASNGADVQGDVDEVFAGEGFVQLCLASGGVPRDFLVLFVDLGTQFLAGQIDAIGKVEVSAAAIQARQRKYDALPDDAGDERERLEHYVQTIRTDIYDKRRTNTFLVAKDDLEQYPEQAQGLRELVDLRLLHLADRNTSSAPSDGRRYEAYMLDVSLYDNPRPRNFGQLLPGAVDDKSRADALRASPRLNLSRLQ